MSQPQEPRKHYYVVAPQGLGDTLEATPLITALRHAQPEARIDAIVLRPQARDLLTDIAGAVDSVYYLPYWEQGAAAFIRAAARLPFFGKADAAFLAYPAARPVYLALLSLVNARTRYAHAYGVGPARSLAGIVIRQIPIRPIHNVLRNLDLLRAAGIVFETPEAYAVPHAWRSDWRAKNRIIMHVGTIAHDGLEARRWPENSFAELGRRLIHRNLEVVILSGPAEREASDRVVAAVPGSTLLTTSLDGAARALAAATAVVANDNGVAHVAAGVGTPVLALFGPTPVEHGPYGRLTVAFRPTECPPCFDIATTGTSCKLGIDYACLKRDLTVDLAEARLLRLLADSGSEERVYNPTA